MRGVYQLIDGIYATNSAQYSVYRDGQSMYSDCFHDVIKNFYDQVCVSTAFPNIIQIIDCTYLQA